MISRPCRPVFAVLSLCLLGLATATARAAVPREVLVLFDEDNDLPGLAAINRSLRDGLRGAVPEGIVFYSESLQLSQFKNPDYDSLQQEYFSRKYAAIPAARL